MKRFLQALVFAAALAASPHAFAQAICPVQGHATKVVTGTSYTVGATDLCRTITLTNSGSVSITLPYPTTMGGLNFWTSIFMEGSGSATVTPGGVAATTAPTINGSSTLSLAAGQSAQVMFGTDGKWYASAGTGGSGTAGAAGVTCPTGSPSASFATTSGLVIHC